MEFRFYNASKRFKIANQCTGSGMIYAGLGVF